MSTLRTIASPPELAQATQKVLSADGRLVACRVEGEKAGLYQFDVGGLGRPLKLDQAGRRFHSPSWTAWGDLLFHVDGPAPAVGAVPAFGRGSAAEFSGTGIAVSADGRVLAVADPGAKALRVAVVEPGNSPFHQPLQTLGELEEADPRARMEVDVTRDGNFVVLVRHARQRAPSLWSVPSAGGDLQELIPQLSAPAALAFALGRTQLGVLEIRLGATSTSKVYVRPMAPGSLGLMRLGPARDLFFARTALPTQRPAFSPDGKKVAVIAYTNTPSGSEMALELLPTAGGKPVRAAQALDLRGSAHFLESGEVAVDGFERISVVTL
ncbi:MAG: hypothetical protein HY901_04505 [Deltaproteobacteria bacterium]|nr:hypothetical protein [Deltaproteobacteria bacterium]